mmetsp:Transcript_1278/g.2806  ORF Transcript_1278/g.2806 Transcript_1278/m.2806 type:complete len:455 (+) Transcript_1278:91-1455(+)
MGGSQSNETLEEGGFRVFKVNAGSPAEEACLEVFFDFIMDIDGTPMDENPATFSSKIVEAENRRVPISVYNVRTQATRSVYISPRKWGGVGLLGAVVRYDSLSNVDNQGIRVLEVFANSPAADAGLLPFQDYLLGTSEVMFRDMDELSEVVTWSIDKEVSLFVYNSNTETIREAKLKPRLNWGGEGVLGADIRTGLLHRIPPPRKPLRQPSSHIPNGHTAYPVTNGVDAGSPGKSKAPAPTAAATGTKASSGATPSSPSAPSPGPRPPSAAQQSVHSSSAAAASAASAMTPDSSRDALAEAHANASAHSKQPVAASAYLQALQGSSEAHHHGEDQPMEGRRSTPRGPGPEKCSPAEEIARAKAAAAEEEAAAAAAAAAAAEMEEARKAAEGARLAAAKAALTPKTLAEQAKQALQQKHGRRPWELQCQVPDPGVLYEVPASTLRAGEGIAAAAA